MAISAQELNVILTARDKQFTAAMLRSQRQVQRFATKSQKQLSGTGIAFGALGKAAKRLAPILAAAFTVQAARGALDTAAQIQNLSNIAGVTTDKFQVLALATQRFGVDQDKLSDILKDVNDKFGDFVQTGAGPLADFFENIAPKVGLTAASFADLSSDQKLGAYVNALESANLSQADMTFYMEAIASDSTALIGAFQNSGAAINEMATRAEELGVIMNEDLIAGSADAKAELDLMSRAISNELTEALLHLAPLLVGGATALAKLANGVGSVVDVVAGLFESETDLEKAMSLAETAIDNSTLAMGDQIRQSALLEARTSSGNVMTLEAARVNLASAKARLEDVAAMESQNRAQARATLGLDDIAYKITNAMDAVREARDRLTAEDIANMEEYGDLYTSMTAEVYRELEMNLALLLAQQQELNAAFNAMEFLTPEQKEAQAVVLANIARIETAIEETSDGMVSFNGEVTTGVELTDRLAEGAEGVTLANAEDSSRRLSSSLRENVLLAAQLSAIGGGGSAPSPDAIFDPRSNTYDPAAQTLSNALQATIDAQAERQKVLAELRGSFEETGEAAELSTRGAGAAAREATEDYIGLSDAVISSQDALSSVMSTMESSMESAFMSMIDGTKSAEDAFKAMGAEIIKELYRVLVVKRITGFITSAVGGFFNMNQVSGPAMPLGTGNISPPIRPRASGGTASAGNPYMTGEHGRELFVPQVNGRILSAAQTRNATSGGGGVSVVQNINISTGVAQTVRTEIRTLMPQIADAAKSAVVDAKLRGGSYGRSFG
jgi:hypothetical protein